MHTIAGSDKYYKEKSTTTKQNKKKKSQTVVGREWLKGKEYLVREALSE